MRQIAATRGEFKPVWIRAKDRSDNDFHMSHEVICCSDLSQQHVAAICRIVCFGLKIRDLNCKLSDRAPPDKIALGEGGTVQFETHLIDTVGGTTVFDFTLPETEHPRSVLSSNVQSLLVSISLPRRLGSLICLELFLEIKLLSSFDFRDVIESG